VVLQIYQIHILEEQRFDHEVDCLKNTNNVFDGCEIIESSEYNPFLG